jgi:Protein of unknown function (DUF3592)
MRIKKRSGWLEIVCYGLLLLAGLVFLSVATKTWVDSRHFLATAVSTRGDVVDIVEVVTQRSGEADQYHYEPVVRFLTPQEEVVEFQADESIDRKKVRVGDQIRILYDPENPSEARLDSALSRWGWSAIFLAFGIVFTTIGGILLYRKVRPGRGTP